MVVGTDLGGRETVVLVWKNTRKFYHNTGGQSRTQNSGFPVRFLTETLRN